MSALNASGHVWKFGDDINTDLIFPSSAFRLSLEEQVKCVFSANRPGWVDQVQHGDILVGGRNFGTGSGRPAAALLRELGISVLVADSINGLFFRNSINHALPAIQCPGVSEAFEEGDEAEVDLATGSVRNLRSGMSLPGRGLPRSLLAIVEAGGILEMLRAEGYTD